MKSISRFFLISMVVLVSSSAWASTTTKCYSCDGGTAGTPCTTADGKAGTWRADETISGRTYHVCSNAIANVGPKKTSDRLPANLTRTATYIPTGTVIPSTTGTTTNTGKPADKSTTKKPVNTTGTSTTTGTPQQQNQ